MIVVAVVAVLIAAAIELGREIEEVASNGYRVQEAGDLLVDYMRNVEEWPRDWEDLHRYVESGRLTFEHAPNIQELRTHVRIDFGFDPSEVDVQLQWSDEKPAIVVVSSRYGRTAGATRNPNQYIYEYLRGDHQE